MTTPEREKVRQKKLTCTQKTASREIFSYCVKTGQENRFQSPELHQGNRLTTTKIAPGIPYWPSRDPINELGEIDLYAMLRNNTLSKIDLLGLYDPNGPRGPFTPTGPSVPCCGGKAYDADKLSCCGGKTTYDRSWQCCSKGKTGLKQPLYSAAGLSLKECSHYTTKKSAFCLTSEMTLQNRNAHFNTFTTFYK